MLNTNTFIARASSKPTRIKAATVKEATEAIKDVFKKTGVDKWVKSIKPTKGGSEYAGYITVEGKIACLTDSLKFQQALEKAFAKITAITVANGGIAKF